MALSCSFLRSSAICAASPAALRALSSAARTSLPASSRSAFIADRSCSSFLFWDESCELVDESSLTRSAASISSASADFLPLSACSSKVLISSISPLSMWQRRSDRPCCSRSSSLCLDSSSIIAWISLSSCWNFLPAFSASARPLLAISSCTSSSLMSCSSFFLSLMDSALPLLSASRVACMDSRALAWLRLVFSNSSSFSWILLSISDLVELISIWNLITLASSVSRACSASSRAACSSSFSASSLRLIFSSSWVLRPPSDSCSVRSLISSASPLFSRFRPSITSPVSSNWAFSLKISVLYDRASRWLFSSSVCASLYLASHSAIILSKCFCFFSAATLALCALSHSNITSSSSIASLDLAFSRELALALADSTSSSISAMRACIFLFCSSTSSLRPNSPLLILDFSVCSSPMILALARWAYRIIVDIILLCVQNHLS